METLYHIPKTKLARNTRQVIRRVQQGQTVVVESHGQPEAAIIDIVDYQILRAVMSAYASPSDIEPEAGLSDESVTAITTPQEKYNLIMAHYLAGAISLARTAELLDLTWLDLRTRCLRLNVPLRTAPAGLDEARMDIENAAAWAAGTSP